MPITYFPSREGHINGDQWTKTLRKKTGLEFSIHDLRRTYATVAESCDIPFLALKALLNHSVGSGITERYVAMTPERLREPAQKVADRIRSLIGITAPSGNVAVLRASG